MPEDHHPSGGATLLLTRPAAQSAACAAAFGARHPEVPVVISPILAIRARPVLLPPGAALILTSQNAVAALPEAARGRTAWCVGAATAAAAAARGLHPAGWAEDAAGLCALLLDRRPAAPLVHVAGEHRAADLAGMLGAGGLQVETQAGYAQDPQPLSPEAAGLLAGRGAVLLPLFSPRSARLVAAAGPVSAPLLLAALSGAVAEAWTEAWAGPAPRALRIAAHPTSEAMLHALTVLINASRAA